MATIHLLKGIKGCFIISDWFHAHSKMKPFSYRAFLSWLCTKKAEEITVWASVKLFLAISASLQNIGQTPSQLPWSTFYPTCCEALVRENMLWIKVEISKAAAVSTQTVLGSLWMRSRSMETSRRWLSEGLSGYMSSYRPPRWAPLWSGRRRWRLHSGSLACWLPCWSSPR